jgi:hypothetical protein
VTNHRLRGALYDAELTPQALALRVGVDSKSVGRWISEDRVPYPSTRAKVAHILNQHETFLWPALLQTVEAAETALGELEHISLTRSAISSDCWHRLFGQATARLDLLVYAGGFLIESLDLSDVLRLKAAEGVAIRVLIGEAASSAVRTRADELDMPWLPARCLATAHYLTGVAHVPGVQIRRHSATLYASLFRFDDIVLVNDHVYGVWACHSPVYHLRRAVDGHLFDFYADALDRVWAASSAAGAQGSRTTDSDDGGPIGQPADPRPLTPSP